MSDKPNILYIFTDQQESRSMSCSGNSDLKTPAIDCLASRGTMFDKAYCTFPLCTPSRASMFTGMMPHETGIACNGQPIADKHIPQGLGHVLSAGGYECAYGGKWHVPQIEIPDSEHGFRKICGFSDTQLPDRCAEFLQEKHESPFFLVASFDNPHNICEWSRNQPLPWGNVPDARVEDCPGLPANFALAPYEAEAMRYEQDASYIYRKRTFTPDDWRRYRYAYYRMMELIDNGVARILEALDKAGLADDTLVIFSSDHGDGIGAHQWNQKSVLYEESVRVPLIIAPPGGAKASVDNTHLVSNGLDLFPTICDYAGVSVPTGLNGMSLRPVLEGKSNKSWRKHVVSETNFDHGTGTSGLMVRTDRYKYCLYSWGKNREQLFDMDTDPGEMVNLAVRSHYGKIVQQHRDILADWIRQTDYRHHAHYSHRDQFPLVPGQQYGL